MNVMQILLFLFFFRLKINVIRKSTEEAFKSYADKFLAMLNLTPSTLKFLCLDFLNFRSETPALKLPA